MQQKTMITGLFVVLVLAMVGAATVSGHTKYAGTGDTPLYSLRLQMANGIEGVKSERMVVEYVSAEEDGDDLGFAAIAGAKSCRSDRMMLAESEETVANCWTTYPSVDCISTCYSNPCGGTSYYGGSIDCETVYPDDPSCAPPTSLEVGCTTILEAGAGSNCGDGKPQRWYEIAYDVISLFTWCL